MQISVIIPNYNGVDLLRQSLPKVQQWIKNYDAEIIVVDDASTDESVEFLNTQDVRVVAQKQNGRFAKAVNAGVQNSDAEFVYLLNSDAYPESDFLGPLLPHFDDPKVFAVGSKSGGTFVVGEFKDGAFFHHQADVTPTSAHKTLWASGGMSMFRREIYQELGGMDPIYSPFYWEDIDLSYRAWKRGYKVLWEPNSIIVHTPETTNRRFFTMGYKDMISERNHLIFVWKNIHTPHALIQNKIYILKRIVKDPRYLKIVFMFLGELGAVLAKRRQESQFQKVSDIEVLNEISRT